MRRKELTAIGMIELSSIAKGFLVADTVLKTANVEIVVNRTVCPGKYMVLLGGSVDAVTASVDAGVDIGERHIVDHFIIPNVHPEVFPAFSGLSRLPELRALGVIEAFSTASIIEAADAAVKAANITLLNIHIAMAIGGKGFVSLTGDVAAVQAAVDAGSDVVMQRGLLVETVVIPSLRQELITEFI